MFLTKFKFQIENQKKILPFYFLVLAIILVSVNFFFFWDKDILHSRHAFWYLENGFSILQPPDFDSGHPPVMGLLLAFLWKIFGVNLVIGHLAMIPFAFALVWQLYRFTAFFIKSDSIYWALLLVIIDTSILTQFVILTGDLLTLIFFFWSINSILYKKRISLLFALIFLAITSSRGMLSCVIIGFFDCYLILRRKENFIRRIIYIIPYYLPAIIVAGSYLVYHHLKTGWTGYEPDGSNWGGLFELVDFKGALKNVFIIAWRLVDFGRLFLWFAGFYFAYIMLKKRIQSDDKIRTLAALFIISIVVYMPLMVIYTGLLGHRYLLPLFVIFTILITYFIFEKISDNRLKKVIYSLLLLGLLSGNFWVYPDNIAKGWDSTLAHIPYYKLRRDMIKFIEKEGIPFEKIGSEVPNASSLKYIDLSGDERFFTKKNLKDCEYIFYSNIYNMFTDEFLQELKNEWVIIEEYKKLQVRVTLYKNPRFD